MQITIEHIAALEADSRAAEALRVGHVAHPADAERAIRRACAFLEEQRKAIPAVGTADIFGDTMTSDAWYQRAQDNNNAAVRVRQIARILGIDLPADE